MKILMLCNKLPYPANDGSSIAMAKMIEGFVAQKAEVFILSLNTKKHFKNIAEIPKKIASAVHFTVVDVNTNPTASGAFANLFQKLPFHVSRFFIPEVSKKLSELLAKNTFDIVQIEGIFMMPYVSIVQENSQAKIALRTHNVEHQIWERALANKKTQFVLKAFLRNQTKKLKRYENGCAKTADAIVAISEKDANYFHDFNSKIITIPCGIESVHPVQKINNQSFFHLGAMDWLPNQQGIEWLLNEVWPIVSAKNNTLQLHLAGRAMSQHLLQTKITGVTIHGEIKNAQTFRAAHGIMLVPLLAGSGIRIKIIEGLAEGIPIISTQIGAEGIPANHNQEIIFADSAQEFAQAILDLANNAEKCRTIGKNAATLAANNYTNSKLAATLLDFYTW